MKYSILIPAYNASNYIERSLSSVLIQRSMYDYEIIVCDDGSTDNTLTILNNFNDKIKIIKNNENQGGIITRKKLAIESCGEYIIWLDADDELSPYFLSTLDNYVHNNYYDIIDLSFNCVNSKGEIAFCDRGNFELVNDNLLELFFKINYKWYLWSKAIKRSIMIKALPPDFKFPIDDVFFTMQVFYYAQSYLSLNNESLYNYYIGIGKWSSVYEGNVLELSKFKKICENRIMEFKYNLSFLIKTNMADVYQDELLQICDFNELLLDLLKIPTYEERRLALILLKNYITLHLSINI